MNKLVLLGGAICLFLVITSVGLSSQSEPVVINLMICTDTPALPTIEQQNIFSNSLVALTNQIAPKGLNATIYVSGDAARFDRLPVTYQASKKNYEIAMHGNATDEKLDLMSYSVQERVLKNAKYAADKCYICGETTENVTGFMPQSFDQNEDTYKILEGMGIKYIAGFKAGLLYLPGHEADNWPYPIKNYNIYAVPISTYNLSGERVLLYDKTIKEKGLTGNQWYDLLVKKFNQSSENGGPMIVVFSNSVSGNMTDYLNAYTRFMDYATERKAKFVTTMELVDMASGSVAQSPASVASKPICPECDQQKNNGSGFMIKATSNCTTCGNVTKKIS